MDRRKLRKTLERTFRQRIKKMDTVDLGIQTTLNEKPDGTVYIDDDLTAAFEELYDLLSASIRKAAISDTSKVSLRKILANTIGNLDFLTDVFTMMAEDAADQLEKVEIHGS